MGDAEAPTGGIAASAASSAQRAERAADQASDSADRALRSAAEAAVAAALATELPPIRDAISALQAIASKLTDEEVADDKAAAETAAELGKLATVVAAFQSQSLWLSSGLVLFGMALAYVMQRIFG